ncbi:MAG: lysostaphin resistance A-like protein [Tenacibaculum sp.]
MKSLSKQYPKTYTYCIAIVLFGVSLIASTFINQGNIKKTFPYIATITLTIATWFLYKREHKSLNHIGLNFKNIKLLPLGICIGASIFLIATYIRALYLGEQFHISNNINYQTISLALYTILPTVAVEEFLFRGYLFKKTIEYTSTIKANIIFAIAFTAIHILDENVLQKPTLLILLCTTIPIGHLLFATALLKSNSLYLPIGIHLGNNWATRHLITSSNNGESIFYITNTFTFTNWTSFIFFIIFWNTMYIIAIYCISKWKFSFFS